jgi:hypothetical protein
MKTFIGIAVGAVVGLFFALCVGKPLHDLIWARDMEGDSACFTVVFVVPVFTILGAAVVGWLWRRGGGTVEIKDRGEQ